MALQIKIQGATPKGGRSICTTCKHAKVVHGQNCEERIICTPVFNGIVTFKVASCGEYHPSNIPWLYEMERIAWKIEARKRGQSGFRPEEPGEMQVIVTAPKDSGLPE